MKISHTLAAVLLGLCAIPAEAKLTRNAAGSWDGTLVLTLPAR